MNTTSKNNSIYRYISLTWPKKKNILMLLIFLLILFSSINVSAQEQKNVISKDSRILERKSFVADLRASEQSARSSYSNAQRIETLLSKVQPAAYCYSGTVKTYGEKPVCLFTDIQSLRNLSDQNILRDNIEMLTIKIQSQSDLNTTIDMNNLSEFKNLKYVQIVSTVPTTESTITKMILNNDEKYNVFYTIQTGDSE